MNLINTIRERLDGHPEVILEEGKDFICAVPRSDQGFKVSLLNEGFQFTITYGDGWHEYFQSSQEALNCFGFGLTERCRLKVTLTGGSPYKWTVEYHEGNDWVEDSTTGLIFFPFWKSKDIIYLQNRITTKKKNGEWLNR